MLVHPTCTRSPEGDVGATQGTLCNICFFFVLIGVIDHEMFPASSCFACFGAHQNVVVVMRLRIPPSSGNISLISLFVAAKNIESTKLQTDLHFFFFGMVGVMSLLLTELLCIVVPPFLLPESSEVLRSDMSLKADELGVAAMKRSELAAG